MAGADIWELTRSGEADAANSDVFPLAASSGGNGSVTSGNATTRATQQQKEQAQKQKEQQEGKEQQQQQQQQQRVASPQSAPFWVVTDAHAPGFETPIRDTKGQDVTLSAVAEGAQAARELWLSSAPVKALSAGGNSSDASAAAAAAAALAPTAANALAVVLKRRLVTCDEGLEDMQLRFGRPLFWIWARGAEEGDEGGGGGAAKGQGPTRVSYHGPQERGAVLAAPWGPQPPGARLLPLPTAAPAPPPPAAAAKVPPPAPPAAAREDGNKPAASAPPAKPPSSPTHSDIPLNARTLDLTIGGDLMLPQGKETVYVIRPLKLPADQKYHAVAYAPLFHEPFVHHAVLYACSDEGAQALEKKLGASAGGGKAGGGGGASSALSPGQAASVAELRARSGAGEKGDELKWRPSGGSDKDWAVVAAEEGEDDGLGTATGGGMGRSFAGGCMKFWALGAPTGGVSGGHHGGTMMGGSGGKDGASFASAEKIVPAFVAPPGTGIPFGGGGEGGGEKRWWPTHLLLEMHYNNPAGDKGLVDRNSGMRVWYVPAEDEKNGGGSGKSGSKRADLGLLTNAQYALSIPPGLPSFTAAPSLCSAACTARALGKAAPQGVTVVGRTYHMHGLGKSALTRRFRPAGGASAAAAADVLRAASAAAAARGIRNTTTTPSSSSSPSPLRFTETPPISQLDRYDYNYQAFLPPVRDGVSDQLLPGDALLATWTFDSTSRDKPTRFGPATGDEMAFDWLMYYPAVPELSSCLSVPLRGVAGAMLQRAVAAASGAAGGSGSGNKTAAAGQNSEARKSEALDWASGSSSSPSAANAASSQQQQKLQQALQQLPETLAICAADDGWAAKLFGALAGVARKVSAGGGAGGKPPSGGAGAPPDDALTKELAALIKGLYDSGDAVPALPDAAAMAAAGGGKAASSGGGGARTLKEASAPGSRACSSKPPAP
jgi:hypothetical protein